MSEMDTGLTSTGRRWLYGFNVAVLVIIGVAIIALLMVLTANLKPKLDLTSNRQFSLSGYTHQLLKQIDAKGQKYQLVSLFPPGDTQQNENRQQILDLLDEYARTSPDITYKEAGELGADTITQEIRDRYSGELKPYQDAVAKYKKVADDLDAFAKQEAAAIGALAQQPGNAKNEDFAQQAAMVQNLFASDIPEMLAHNKMALKRDTESTSPDWDKAVSTLKQDQSPLDSLTLQGVKAALTMFTNGAQMKDRLPALAPYFAVKENGARYAAMRDEVKAYLDLLNGLKPLKVSDVLASLDSNSVLILGPASAAVIPQGSLFKVQGQGAPGQPPPQAFAGEEAISSGLLAMTEPEKVKVVFVTSGPSQPTTSPAKDGWADMADELRQANFDVSEWNPPGPQTNPEQPPPPATPPAEGKGVVWIVFPPDSDPQMAAMGMPANPEPMIAAVRKHMEEGGQVLFLADAQGLNPMMMGAAGAPYAYADLIKPFGITVLQKYIVVHDYPVQGGKMQPYPEFSVSRYPDDVITAPLQSLQTSFRPVQNQQTGAVAGLPTVVSVNKTLPSGVDARVIVQAPDDGDTWGEANFSPTATFNKDVDYAPPCPVAAAAEKKSGGSDDRIVVIGSRTIGDNELFEEGSVNVDEEGRIVGQPVPSNPGNGELIRNAVLWLAGYKNMIAVGSKAAAAQRIGDVSPHMLSFLRWLVLAIIPATALILGGVAWMCRRR